MFVLFFGLICSITIIILHRSSESHGPTLEKKGKKKKNREKQSLKERKKKLIRNPPFIKPLQMSPLRMAPLHAKHDCTEKIKQRGGEGIQRCENRPFDAFILATQRPRHPIEHEAHCQDGEI